MTFFFSSFLYLYLRQQQWKSELFIIVFKIRALHYNAEINVMPHRFVFEVNCSEVPSSLLRLYRNKAFSFRINFFYVVPFSFNQSEFANFDIPWSATKPLMYKPYMSLLVVFLLIILLNRQSKANPDTINHNLNYWSLNKWKGYSRLYGKFQLHLFSVVIVSLLLKSAISTTSR